MVATDTTTVGQAGNLELIKWAKNVTQANAPYSASTLARPGDELWYVIYATNRGTAALSNLVVNDATPAYTSFIEATCPTPLPTGITGCAVTQQPAVGGKGPVQWTFTGALPSGASGDLIDVYLKVKVDQ